MRRVGIIGGMGPEATILIMQKVLAQVSAKDDADHIPMIIDQNTQVPSRIKHLIEGTGENPGPVLADMARRLVAAGADALAMPCNTAHHFTSVIKDAVNVPFLDMIELSVAHAADLAGTDKTVGILASPAVRMVGLFDVALAQVGLTALYASNESDMLAAIRLIKVEGPQEKSRNTLQAASQELAERGAKVQLIACTEFSLIANSVAPGIKVFDTLDILAQAIKKFALQEGVKERMAEHTA